MLVRKRARGGEKERERERGGGGGSCILVTVQFTPKRSERTMKSCTVINIVELIVKGRLGSPFSKTEGVRWRGQLSPRRCHFTKGTSFSGGYYFL